VNTADSDMVPEKNSLGQLELVTEMVSAGTTTVHKAAEAAGRQDTVGKVVRPW